jgi:soluble lytic murein transglycosylase
VDEWVEQIPFSETRGYVKRVLGSYGAYRLVYGGAPPPLDDGGGRVAAREPRQR